MGSAAETTDQEVVTAEFGLSVLRFDYTELDFDNTILDRELGGITGLSFRLAQRRNDWEWEGRTSYHYGRVEYIGRTQAGAAHKTLTDEEVSDFSLRLGHWLEGRYSVMPYAGFGYRHWNRDILPNGNVGGLFESYRWNYAWLGVKILASQQSTSSLMVDIGWVKPIYPVMYIDIYQASLNLESRDGLKLMLTSRRMLDKNTTLTLEPYFEYWQLGASPKVHFAADTVWEPDSVTRNLGVNIRLGKVF